MRPSVRRDEGFTFVELLVVVVIIGVLAAVAIPLFANQRARGIDAQVTAQVNNVVKATETLLADATGSLSGSSASGSVEVAGGAAVTVATTHGVSWTISGDARAYCIASWAESGRYRSDAPLYYDSTVGRILPQGVMCSTHPGDDDGGGTPAPEAHSDIFTRELRSINDAGVFSDFQITEVPAASEGATLVTFSATWTLMEASGTYAAGSSAQARIRCIDTTTNTISHGTGASTLRRSGSTTVSTSGVYSAATTCPAGSQPYDFIFSPATESDPWWVSTEYLTLNGMPTPAPDPYADKVAMFGPVTVSATRPVRSVADKGVMEDFGLTVTEVTRWQYKLSAKMTWTFMELDEVPGSTANHAARCITPSGKIRIPTGYTGVSKNGNGQISGSGLYTLDITCPIGSRPYDYVVNKADTSFVHADPWWVSDVYLEMNGTPPAVPDPYLDLIPDLADAQGGMPTSSVPIGDFGTVTGMTLEITQNGRYHYGLASGSMTFTKNPASSNFGNTNGVYRLRCVTPGGAISTPSGGYIMNSVGNPTLGASGTYTFATAQCREGSIPYDYVQAANGDTTPVIADPLWVSNRYVQMNS